MYHPETHRFWVRSKLHGWRRYPHHDFSGVYLSRKNRQNDSREDYRTVTKKVPSPLQDAIGDYRNGLSG